MINYSQLVKVAKPAIKHAGRFIKSNPHYLIEGLLGGGLLVSIGHNVKSEN